MVVTVRDEYEYLDVDVTVNEHSGTEGADAFEQYIHDCFQMYDSLDVDVTVADGGGESDE